MSPNMQFVVVVLVGYAIGCILLVALVVGCMFWAFRKMSPRTKVK